MEPVGGCRVMTFCTGLLEDGSPPGFLGSPLRGGLRRRQRLAAGGHDNGGRASKQCKKKAQKPYPHLRLMIQPEVRWRLSTANRCVAAHSGAIGDA